MTTWKVLIVEEMTKHNEKKHPGMILNLTTAGMVRKKATLLSYGQRIMSIFLLFMMGMNGWDVFHVTWKKIGKLNISGEVEEETLQGLICHGVILLEGFAHERHKTA